MSHGLGGASTIGPTGPTGPAGPTGPTGAAGGGLNLIATASASNDATVEFSSGIDSTYDEYIVSLLGVVPALDEKGFWLRTGGDGGASFDSGASDYQWVNHYAQHNTSGSSGNTSDSEIQLAGMTSVIVGSAANESGVNGHIHLIRPAASTYTDIWGQVGFETPDGELATQQVAGQRQAAAAVDAIQFLFSSGNIESGEFKLYGVVKS